MRWWRRPHDRDLDHELRTHLELETEEQESAGLTPDAARYAAQRAFGNTTLIQEVTREMWRWLSWDRFRQDLTYSFRTLRRSPGFTAAAVLSLGLCIGANTAIFSLLNAVLIRNLPVRDPQQVVQLTYTYPKGGHTAWNSSFAYPQLEAFQAHSKTLSGIFGRTRIGRLNLAFRGVSGLAGGEAYTANFFSVLGLTPERGRFFSADEDKPGASVVVLSDRYWRSRFGADPAIVGATVAIDQVPFTVIGVTPPQFSGIYVGSDTDVWLPMHALDRLRPDPKRWTATFTSWILIAGRLRPDVTTSQAQAELDVIHRQVLVEELATSEVRGWHNIQSLVRESHLVLRSAATGTVSGVQEEYALPLKLLMCVAGIVLIVACANIANLLLARASNRRREIAVRLALGAGRARIVRQLMTETAIVAVTGGMLALALARWGSGALVRMISTGETPIPLNIHPDWRIFGFTTGVSLIAGILFGVAPALRGTRLDPAANLKEGSRNAGRSSRALDRFLVVLQVGFSVVLIMSAGLFVRTVQKLWRVNVGYERGNVLMFSVDTKLGGYPDQRAGMVYREVLDRLRTLPDVQSASASIVRPVDDNFDLVDRVDYIDGQRVPEGSEIHVSWNSVSPGYFSTVSTPIVQGRDFEWRDTENAPKVVIVSETLAKFAFPRQNPLGHKLGDSATIVGVAKDTRYHGPREAISPVLYYPLFQHGHEQEYHWGFVSYELRYRLGAGLLAQARREVAAVDRNLPIFRAKTLQVQAEESLLRERLLATLSGFFGGLALLLSCIGLYGLMAFTVAVRTAEIGIRVALGSGRANILWLVLRETAGLVVLGVLAGMPFAMWAARYAKSLLFGVTASDPLTAIATAAILMTVALVAGYVPARRALRVDPMVALRCE
ncbi:MAG TPA: ABC transporter permease [Bryobacteraceae bacterium]|nr:ABC transporter permease [Bryobacteraceae bacterium]